MKLKSNIWKLGVAAFALAFAGGCNCNRPGPIGGSYGDIGVIFEEDHVSKTSRDAVYDFGAVFMGTHNDQSMKLTVKNIGRGTLSLDKLEQTGGSDTVSIGDATGTVWEVKFSQKALSASEVAEFEMVFNAPQAPETIVDHEVKLVLRASNTDPTDPGSETATITLRARAVSGACDIPKVLDFGSVAVGDVARESFEMTNPSAIDAIASIGDPYSSSGDDKAFGYSAESARGTITLKPGTKRKVEIQFQPTASNPYLAFAKMRASAQCPEVAVQLTGTGVDQVLSWTPNPMDFGYVTPGFAITKELTFVNASKVDANLTAIKANLGDFKVMADVGVDTTKLTVPGAKPDPITKKLVAGQAKVVLQFKPAVLGPRNTTLSFNTSLPKQPSGAAQLKGYGGGPDIKVIPSPTMNFGKVAYFAGSNSFQTRKLTVMNVGTKPATNDPNANLKLGLPGGVQPYIEAKPMNADSLATEIEIVNPPTTGTGKYDPATGLIATAGQNSTDFQIKIIPSSVAKKEFELTVHSNDPDSPDVKINVTADVVLLPPCNYSVTPANLNFGLITPPQYKDLAFTITNNGQNASDICLLSNLDIGPSSDAIFSLPAGPIASKEMQPGESMNVLVRAWPQTGQVNSTTITPANGSVVFYMSSPTNPSKTISLAASIAQGCLTIAPNDLDFGTVQKGCNSTTRTFSIYNTCTTSVVLNSFSMQAAAGEPAGGPNCPGTSPCPEFLLVSTPAIPTGGLSIASGGTPTTFTAKYKPINLGSDTGAIALNAVQSGQNVTYIVTLKGNGDTAGLNTDVFTQDAKPKADILLIIDNSGSMGDKQTALANNFGSFIKYAISAQVDYHIAVTTTDIDPGGANGAFVTGSTHPETVLTPTTANVEQKFKDKVNVGTVGSGYEREFEPALKAMTAPLITGTNAGFLRNDAALAMVAITDEDEQSAQPVTYYYNNYMNIKGVNRANMFTFNAIFGKNSGVGTCFATPDPGRLHAMVSQTNGVEDDICTPDWSKTLEQLGKTAFGFRTNFFLNGVPDLTNGKTIVVKIDGNALPNVDSRGSTVWTYDPVANSVNFEPMFVPEPGQTLTITYYVACL